MKKLVFTFLFTFSLFSMYAQQCPCECAYPVLYLHGWISNSDTWFSITNPAFQNVWGARADVFHAAANATTSENIKGNDNLINTADDDIKWVFGNENNVLAPGCIYAMNLDVRVESNGDVTPFPAVGGAPGLFDADNNESAIMKQGALVGKAIQAILAANPTKKKVILVGHSMGGLAAREYLQRTVNNNATSAKRWWVTPSQADGHKVAKLLTIGTPHRGSNTMGNLSNLRQTPPYQGPFTARQAQPVVVEEAETPTIDNMLPDLASEAVRDLRYSYDNISLFSPDFPGVYLYGGKETDIPTFPYSYWNNDVNCDGATTMTTQVGINQDGRTVGKTYAWDGTQDNPSMPLPLNVKYTYYISNTLSGGVLAGGDLVVDDQRQWIFKNGTGSGTGASAGIPVPADAVNYRLSDRILLQYGPSHVAETADVDNMVRGLDEGDYPAFAFDVNTNVWYAGMSQVRATEVPETPNNTDPDWFKFTLTTSGKITLLFEKVPGLAGRVDFFTAAPNNYAQMTVNSTLNASFTATSTGTISLATANNLAAGTYYIRIRHNAVTATSWQTPYRFKLSTTGSRPEAGSFVGFENETPLVAFSAFPNPASDNLTMSLLMQKSQPIQITMLDITGREVKRIFEDTPEVAQMLEIETNVRGLPAGIYFLQVKGENVFRTERVVIE